MQDAGLDFHMDIVVVVVVVVIIMPIKILAAQCMYVPFFFLHGVTDTRGTGMGLFSLTMN